MDSEKKILWCDLETTGLDPINGKVLEVSAIVTDTQFNVLSFFSEIIHWDKEEIYILMDNFCMEMHGKNGLLAEVELSDKTLGDVSSDFCSFIVSQFGKEKPILTGNTISFDKSFIRNQLPEVDRLLHHRLIDVSGMAEGLNLFLGIEINRNISKHRGLSDIKNSIELAKRIVSALKP